jgi:hypothetical protein
MNDQLRYQMELAAFDEKVALAELEVSKAEERVRELEFEKARFNMQWLELIAKAQQQQPVGPQGPMPQMAPPVQK